MKAEHQLAQASRDEARRQAMTDRTSAFLAASSHALLSLRALALAEMADKPNLERTEVWPTVDRVNSALVAVKINDPDDVVTAIKAVDDALKHLAQEANQLTFSHQQWSARKESLRDLSEQAIAVARAHALILQTGSSNPATG